VSVIPVGPITPATIYIYNIKSKNSSLDEIKQHLGELWLPTSMPQDYIFLLGGGLYSNDEWILMLEYQSGTGSQLLITEHPEIGPLQVGSLPLGTIEQITINNQPAFLDLSTIGTGVSSSPILKSMLLLDFSRGNLEIRIGVIPADSFTGEELIAIAESLVKY
jgi:hypothetical protein